jgi:hypothetical protein
MRRRARTNLFLAATVALLALAVFAEIKREQAMARDPLTMIDPSTVRSLAVSCASCTARRFEKVDGHWMMRAPHDAPAKDEAVLRLAAIASAPVRNRRAAAELDAKKIGLDPPLATLDVDGTILKFGATDAIRNDRYVEVAGMVALVPDRFSAILFEGPERELAEAPPAKSTDSSNPSP